MIYLASYKNNNYWITHFYYNDAKFYAVEINKEVNLCFTSVISHIFERVDFEYTIPENITFIPYIKFDYSTELVGLKKQLDEYLFPIILDNI